MTGSGSISLQCKNLFKGSLVSQLLVEVRKSFHMTSIRMIKKLTDDKKIAKTVKVS